MSPGTDMLDASDESITLDEQDSKGKGQASVFEAAHVIGKIIWELTGKSLGRLVLTFVAVYLASFIPSLLIILWLTVASQSYTRSGLLILVVICLIPIATVMAFNRVAYLGLRDIVKEIGLGQRLGAAFVAYLEPTDRMRIPLTDFTERLKRFTKTARREARDEYHGVRGLFLRAVNATVFYAARFVINRIAKGCVEDGEVDLERFAVAIGERADDMLIAQFKSILWDLTRLVVGVAVLVFWVLLYLVITIINWLT